MIEKLIEKYKQQKFSSDFTKLSLEALMVNQKLDEILQDLEELKERIIKLVDDEKAENKFWYKRELENEILGE